MLKKFNIIGIFFFSVNALPPQSLPRLFAEVEDLTRKIEELKQQYDIKIAAQERQYQQEITILQHQNAVLQQKYDAQTRQLASLTHFLNELSIKILKYFDNSDASQDLLRTLQSTASLSTDTWTTNSDI